MKIKYFKPEDFERSMKLKPIMWPEGWQLMADAANKKLEEFGQITYELNNEPHLIIELEIEEK